MLFLLTGVLSIYITFKDALTKTAADVNKDGKVNPVDALMINRRFVKLIKKFSISDWQFTNPSSHSYQELMFLRILMLCVQVTLMPIINLQRI